MSRPPPFRAEHIGSLLRPAELLHARQQHAAGKLDRNALTAIESEAIARAVKLQEDLDLQVVTDGGIRRGTYYDASNIGRDVYPDLDTFWSDLVEAYVREMRSLAEAGCRYLQIDETSLVKLGDPRVRQLLAERGEDWRDLLHTYIGVINAVVAGAPKDMTIGIHICRSQDPSWQAEAGYDPIAEPLFNAMKVDNYFLEYDN